MYQRNRDTRCIVHSNMLPRSRSGWFAMGLYRYLAVVDGGQLREAHAWRAWAKSYATRSSTAVPGQSRHELRGRVPVPWTMFLDWARDAQPPSPPR